MVPEAIAQDLDPTDPSAVKGAIALVVRAGE